MAEDDHVAGCIAESQDDRVPSMHGVEHWTVMQSPQVNVGEAIIAWHLPGYDGKMLYTVITGPRSMSHTASTRNPQDGQIDHYRSINGGQEYSGSTVKDSAPTGRDENVNITGCYWSIKETFTHSRQRGSLTWRSVSPRQRTTKGNAQPRHRMPVKASPELQVPIRPQRCMRQTWTALTPLLTI